MAKKIIPIFSEREKIHKKIFNDYMSLIRVGSNKAAVIARLAEKYEKHPETIRKIVKRLSK